MSPSLAAKTIFSPSPGPAFVRVRANRLAKPQYSSLVHFSIGWLWHFAQLTDMPRNACVVVSARFGGSSCSAKKLAAPFSSVLPFAVTMARANWSQGGSAVSSQAFSYDLQGRLASVVTAPASGAKTRVDYRYDSSSIRISATEFADASGDGAFSASEQTSTTEYLIDHSNFTGYAQTIRL